MLFGFGFEQTSRKRETEIKRSGEGDAEEEPGKNLSYQTTSTFKSFQSSYLDLAF